MILRFEWCNMIFFEKTPQISRTKHVMLCCTRGGARYIVFILEPATASLREPTHASHRVPSLFITSDGSNSRRFLALLRVAVTPPCVRMFYVPLYYHVVTGFVMYD